MTRRSEAPPVPEPLPAPVVDAHTHLDMVAESAGLDVAAAMARAAQAGVPRVVQVGTDVPTSEWSVATANAHPDIYAAVAVHPNATSQIGDEEIERIRTLAADPRVRAVGETGLDFYRDWAPPEAQERSFRAHIAIAKETGTALMIHDREAHEDVFRVLADEGAPETVVFHCFSGDAAMAARCADLGYVMSFAGNVTFSSAQPLRDAAAVAPLDLMLVETDAPFLTPVPYRGRPNAPDLVALTARRLAEVKGCDVAELCDHLAGNAERVFGPWD